MQVSRFVDV